eukprot:TRINITY_DN2871_c0_g2_i1.p1 TRINITY_DN2871_c0_g2~~TRINITY_DN2871_c0_g2_i1.p1  ORF type:complete len:233 (-),score=4.54 TRINITY_DN2871_c0_g2_i1:35-733(-)
MTDNKTVTNDTQLIGANKGNPKSCQPLSRNIDSINYLSSFFNKLFRKVGKRVSFLNVIKASPYLTEVKEKCKQSVSRRPSWHVERSLEQRVKKSKHRKHLIGYQDIDQKQFDAALDKGEELMSSKAGFMGDKQRLFEAVLRVRDSCKFPKNQKFTPSSVQTVVDEQLNKRASSGYPLFRRKGHVLQETVDLVNDVLNGLNMNVFNWPITRGYRLQIREDISESDIGSFAWSR